MKTPPFFQAPGLLLKQPMGEFFLTSLPAKILLSTAYSHLLKAVLQADGTYRLEGSQRNINPDRLKSIGQFIESPEAAFPNSVILAANFREAAGDLEDDEEKRWRFSFNQDGTSGTLTIPTSEKLAAIIDGQHRLFGFQGVIPEKLEMPLVCAVYFDLPKSYQAYLFAKINANQKPVDKSQTYELFGYSLAEEPPESWTPDKLAVFLARKLNSESDSPLFRHIVIPAENEIVQTMAEARKSGGWMVSLATVVEGIMKLITSNAKNDAHEMLGEGPGIRRQRSKLTSSSNNNRTPLRAYFCATNDTVIYKVVKNFFASVEAVFGHEANSGFIRKTVGFQALFDILRQIVGQALQSKDISATYFGERLANAKRINFTDDFFQASGTGRTRIRNSIEFAIGLRANSDLETIKDGDGYRRVLTGIIAFGD